MGTRSINILGMSLLLLKKEEVIELVEQSIVEKGNSKIIFCTDFRLLYHNRLHPFIFSNDIIYYPDSLGVFLVLKALYFKQTAGFKKLVSTDIHLEILGSANQNKRSIFLVGSTDEVLNSFTKMLRDCFPKIKLLGSRNGFYEFCESDIKVINSTRPDILLVGMGVPRQELWVMENYQRLNAGCIITVGAFFSFYSGKTKRAPKFLRKLSLEWLHRFLQEPARLWRRYLLEYPKFFFNTVFERLKK